MVDPIVFISMEAVESSPLMEESELNRLLSMLEELGVREGRRKYLLRMADECRLVLVAPLDIVDLDTPLVDCDSLGC